MAFPCANLFYAVSIVLMFKFDWVTKTCVCFVFDHDFGLLHCIPRKSHNNSYLSNAFTAATTVTTLVPMTSRDAGRIIIGTAFNSRAQEHGKSMGLKGKALHMRVKRYQDNLWRQLSKAEQAECIEAEQLSAQQLQRLNHHFDEIMEDEQNVAEDLRNFGPDSNAISVPGDTAEPLCILLICIS